MGPDFWMKRFFTVLAGAFVIILIAQMLKGHALSYSAVHSAIWAPITALIFTAARLYQSRKGQHCAICKDTPEMQSDKSGN
jgi:hypothetical protein